MAEMSTAVKSIIARYKTQLESEGIRCEKILVYGSNAQGYSREGSDIDLIVISGDWKKYSNIERLEILGIAAARILEPVQAVGFTPQEIERHDMLPFWEDIINSSKAA